MPEEKKIKIHFVPQNPKLVHGEMVPIRPFSEKRMSLAAQVELNRVVGKGILKFRSSMRHG